MTESAGGRERAEGEDGATAEEALKRAEVLMQRLEEARARLGTTDDPHAAVEVLQDLADIAKEVEREVQRAPDEARDADG